MGSFRLEELEELEGLEGLEGGRDRAGLALEEIEGWRDGWFKKRK